MPGLFHASQQRQPKPACQVTYQSSAEILRGLKQHELDVGVICLPSPLPDSVRVTHRFADAFVLNGSQALSQKRPRRPLADLQKAWLQQQPWLMIHGASVTGTLMRRWLKRQGLKLEPAMELDSFDLIINLVASGMGVALVPRRALALYRRRQAIALLPFTPLFSRDLVVLARRHRKLPPHVSTLIDDILF